MSLIEGIKSLFSEPPALRAERETFIGIQKKVARTGHALQAKINGNVYLITDSDHAGRQATLVRQSEKNSSIL